MSVYVHFCVYVCVFCLSVCACMYVCSYVSVCMSIYLCVCICIFVCLCLFVCVHTYTYQIYTQTQRHTHTQTYIHTHACTIKCISVSMVECVCTFTSWMYVRMYEYVINCFSYFILCIHNHSEAIIISYPFALYSHSYIPVLMAQAKIYWDMENYAQVEKVCEHSS